MKAPPAGLVFRADNIVTTERVGSESDNPLNFIKRRDAAGQVGRVNASASEKSRRSAVGYCLCDRSVWQPGLGSGKHLQIMPRFGIHAACRFQGKNGRR